jgi:hypothetical protein
LGYEGRKLCIVRRRCGSARREGDWRRSSCKSEKALDNREVTTVLRKKSTPSLDVWNGNGLQHSFASYLSPKAETREQKLQRVKMTLFEACHDSIGSDNMTPSCEKQSVIS